MPRNSVQRLLLYTAPALLIAIACAQRYVVHANELTSWKGGGFGMFATLPPTLSRSASVTLITRDGREIEILPSRLDERLPPLPSLQRKLRDAKAMPTEHQVQEFAHALAEMLWVAPPGRPEEAMPMSVAVNVRQAGRVEIEPLPLKAVRVQVWRYYFYSRQGELHRAEMRSVTVPTGKVQ